MQLASAEVPPHTGLCTLRSQLSFLLRAAPVAYGSTNASSHAGGMCESGAEIHVVSSPEYNVCTVCPFHERRNAPNPWLSFNSGLDRRYALDLQASPTEAAHNIMVLAGSGRSPHRSASTGASPTRGPDPLRTPRSASTTRSPGSSSRPHRQLSGGRDATSYDMHRRVADDHSPMAFLYCAPCRDLQLWRGFSVL